ncbi:MAG: hypothetical protein WCI18_10865 [Pseudomonadota bacterium]
MANLALLAAFTVLIPTSLSLGAENETGEKTAVSAQDRALIATPDASSEKHTETGKIIPESTTLPKDVARFRVVYGQSEGTYGYDSKGKKVNKGLKVEGTGGAAVFEYGITPRLGFQFLVPFSLKTKIEVHSKDTFRDVVKAGITTEVNKGFNNLLADPTLSALYNSNSVAPADIAIPGLLTIPAGANVKSVLDGARSQTLASQLADANVDKIYNVEKAKIEDLDFDKGLGDIETGARYSLSTMEEPFFSGIPLYFSVTGGIRWNTSGYAQTIKSGMSPANGRGTTDLGLRLNAEYGIIQGLQMQFENQTEVMLLKGKTYTGGEEKKEVDYERSGQREIGWAKLVVAPGAWLPCTDMVRLNLKYGYDMDAKTKTDGKLQKEDATQTRSQTIGLSFDGLTMGLPLQADLDMTTPISGKNAAFANKSNVFTLKTFYKF